MASVAMAINSSSLLLSMAENAFLRQWWPAGGSLLRQFLQAQPDKLRGLRIFTGAARGGCNGGRGLRLAIAEIDQRRNRIRDRTRRALIVDRAGEMHHGGIDVGKGRRLVLQLGDDALGDLRAD